MIKLYFLLTDKDIFKMRRDDTLGCGVAVAYHDSSVILGKEPNKAGGEQQGQSVLDICGEFIYPLCASWCTLSVLLWTTVIHTTDAGGRRLRKFSSWRIVILGWIVHLNGICFCFIWHGNVMPVFYLISYQRTFFFVTSLLSGCRVTQKYWSNELL